MSSVYGSIVGLDETFQFDKAIRVGGTNMTTPRRYTVGDFDFIPTEMEVDEERCESDARYCRAIDYIAEVSSGISREAFNKNKKYRNAVNLLAQGSADFAKKLEDSSSSSISLPRSGVQVRGARIRGGY